MKLYHIQKTTVYTGSEGQVITPLPNDLLLWTIYGLPEGITRTEHSEEVFVKEVHTKAQFAALYDVIRNVGEWKIVA